MLKIKRLSPAARLPENATGGSAGYDLRALLQEPVTIAPGETALIPTGLAMEIEAGYAGFLFARSGLAIQHGISPANAVGVIDSDYRGEVCVGLHNHSSLPFTVENEDRIAQLVLLSVYTPELLECEELSDTSRGAGGFGSTGRR